MVSTITPDALKEIGLTVDLGERLSLVLVFGPGYLAREGLAEIEAAVGADRVIRHRLDRLGPSVAESVAAASGSSRPVVLVSGLERMSAERHEQVLVSMNLLRDTLSNQPAAIVLWIPAELADEFRRLCVDLFQWRTLTAYVNDPGDEEKRVRHDYLVALASISSKVDELQVQVESEDAPRGIESWLAKVERGILLGPAGSGKSTALLRHAARRANELLDGCSDAELPVVVLARYLIQPRGDSDILAMLASAVLFGTVWLMRQFDSAPAIVLVDGFDEVAPAARMFFADQIPRLVDRNPRLRVVLATRRLPDVSLPPWPKAEVLPLGGAAIEAWLRKLGYDPEVVMERLASEGAKALLASPLFLQMLSKPDEAHGEIDLTRWIDKITDRLLGSWDAHREIFLRVPGPKSEEREQLVDLAMTLISTQSDSASLPRSETLDFIEARSGILRRIGDDPSARYEFTQPSYRDYFAGVGLAERGPEALVEHAADPTWRAATFHALNLLGLREFEHAAEAIWAASTNQDGSTRWMMRMLVLHATSTRKDAIIRTRFVEHAKADLDHARQAGEDPELWSPLAELVERMTDAQR